MDDMYIGKFLDDRYEILERIGSGGMAVVYKALDHRLNRFVAIKILKADLAQDPDLRRRFHAESQAVAMLSHPNIVSVYDVNHSDNTDYIVMELIEGITLKQYINRKGILNWKEALHFTTQIAKALEHAHSRGIIHRDIKPHNIMILKDGTVKVADFGIARLLTTQNTLTRQALGSVHYISPEQAKGSAADARSDIYSVGVVMYEMITSRLPFEGDSAVSIAIQHISSIPLQPREINPDIPVGLEEITMRAMDPNINTRYQSASELLADLEDFRKNPSVRFNYSSVPSLADDDLGGSTRTLPTVKGVSELERARRRVSGNGATKPRVSPEEYRENRRKAGSTTMLVGVVCIILLIAVLFWVIWDYALKDIFDPEDVDHLTVPDFVGAMYDEVTANEEYLNYYTFDPPKYDYASDKPAGYILDQSPSKGSSFPITEKKVSVTLTIAAGPVTITMPDLVNHDYRNAKVDLEGLGMNLDVQTQFEASDTVTKDYVIRTVPEVGQPLTQGGTVYVIASTGPDIPLVKVPDLMNSSETRAQSLLENAQLFGVKHEEYNDTVAKGRVFDQTIPPDTEVDAGTQIDYYISLGPEPTEPPPTTPEDPGTTTPENPGTTPPDTPDTPDTPGTEDPGTTPPDEPEVPTVPTTPDDPGTTTPENPGDNPDTPPAPGEREPGGEDPGDGEFGDPDEGVQPSG